MNGYRIIMPIYHVPPILNITRNNGTIQEINGINYMYTRILESYMNFSIVNTEELDSKDISKMVLNLKQLLDGDEVNMTAIPVHNSAFNYPRHFEASIHFAYEKTVAIVPILPKTQRILPHASLSNISICILFLVIIVLIARMLHFEPKCWNCMAVLRAVLGQSMPQRPQRSLERVFLICVIVLSMTYFSDIFSNLTSVKILTENRNFQDLKDVHEPNFHLFIDKYKYAHVFSSDDDYSIKLRPKFVPFGDVGECVEKLRENRNLICFAQESRAEITMLNDSKYYHTSLMTIVDVKIPDCSLTYIYEKASPFVERIDKLLLRIVQSGIPKSSFYGFRYRSISNEKSSNANAQYQDNISAMELMIFLSTGYAVSFVVCVIEVLRGQTLKNKLDKTKPFRVYNVNKKRNGKGYCKKILVLRTN